MSTLYDIIGDIHGQADKLIALLTRLGYQEIEGVWQHAERKAIFVGDFVDRGPKQLEVLRIVRGMTEGGHAQAVMGNHELNAIAWNTPALNGQGESLGDYLRTRQGEKGSKNRHQHHAFLDEVEEDSDLHKSWTDWFMTLPLYLDLPECRVIHACWHQDLINHVAPLLKDGRFLSEDILQEALTKPAIQTHAHQADISLFDAIEILLKGMEIELPSGTFYLDADKNERTLTRTRWWDHQAHTYSEAALLPSYIRETFPHIILEDHKKVDLSWDKPTFFGHYWMTGEPIPLTEHVACVDYSAARSGPLVAYQLNGPGPLDAKNFVRSDDPLPEPKASEPKSIKSPKM